MYSRSAAFDLAVVDSQVVIFKADVLLNGTVIESDLPITGGQVSVADDAVRRQGALKVVDATGALVPNGSSDLLSPYGTELRIYRGLSLSSGDEFLTVATLRISLGGADGFEIKVSGFDRARSVARARFETPYTVASGTNYVTAIQALLTSRLPGITYNFVSTTVTTPQLVFDQGSDPWEQARKMAQAIGCELFFDPLGVCTMQAQPDPASAPLVWRYDEGPTSMLESVDNVLTDEPGYNGIVVDGEAPGFTPVHSVIYDLDTSSPTYSLGPYGKVPYFMQSEFITTQAQADAAGAAALRRERGGTEQCKFTGITHPASEVGDMVYVLDSDSGVNDNYLIDSFDIPLDVQSTSGFTTRKRRTA